MPEYFQITGADDFAKAAKALEKQGFDAQAGRTVAWAIRRIVNLVRRNARRELGTRGRGRMRDHIRVRITGRLMGTTGGVRSTGSGSNLIVGGVQPHQISPGKVMPLYGGRGKVLSTRGGSAIEGFATVVEHPGFKADPFFHRALRGSQPDIDAIVKASTQTMVKELAFRMRGRK